MNKYGGKIVAFLCVGVLSLASGCSRFNSTGPQDPNEPDGPLAGADQPAPDAMTTSTEPNFNQPDVQPVNINVFGEFDGVTRTVGHGGYGDAGFQQHTFLEEGYDSDVAVDPTGKWLVFTSTRQSVHPNIYLQRTDGMSVIELTSDDANYAYPTFSPDGKQIAFCSTRAGNWDIYVMDMDGKNITQITTGPLQHIHPSFSPDGTKLVYSSLGSRSNQWEIWTVDLNTGEKRMISFGLFPSWSPDKSVDRIAFQRARQRGSRWFGLWTLDMVNGEARRLTEVADSSNAAIVAPTWSPDGQHIAFATIAEPNSTPGMKPVGQEDIWTVDADGANRRRLTDGIGMNLSPFWAADNRVFFVSDRAGTECIWSVEADSDFVKPAKVADKPGGEPSVGDAN
jgi:TolB protein